MLDPLSICSAVGGLVTVCGQTISTCRAIIGSFEDAPRILSAIQNECSTTRESLSSMFILINKSDMTALSHLSSSETLSRSFDIALTGCTVTFSVLENELQKILKHSEDEGGLDFRQRAKFVWSQSALKEAMDELRGQRDALNLLITVVQSHSISEILALLKAKDTVFQDVKRRTDSLHRPRGNAGLNPDDRWDSDSLSIFSEYTEQKFFDFDSVIMRSPAYTRVYSSIRNNQKPRRALKRRLEPIINLLDEDLIDLHDHPTLAASYSLELEKEMSPSSIERRLSAQQFTPSPDVIQDPIEIQIVKVANNHGQNLAPNSMYVQAKSIEEHEGLGASAISRGGEECENKIYTAAPVDEKDKYSSNSSGSIKMDEARINEHKSDKAKTSDSNMDKAINKVDGTASILESLVQISLSNSGSAAVQDNLLATKYIERNLSESSGANPQSTILHADESIDSVATFPPLPELTVGRVEDVQPKNLEVRHNFVLAAALGDTISVRKQLLQTKHISRSALQLALLYASLNGRDAVVEMLLLKGADVNYRHHKEVMICWSRHVNLSPLHLAAAADQGSTVDLLIRCGAHTGSRDNWSWTPLHFAAAGACTSALKILLRHDAIIEAEAYLTISTTGDATNRNIDDCKVGNCTPLYMAAAFGAIETAKVLVDRGANKNVKAEYGLTLVHGASLANCTNYTRIFRERFGSSTSSTDEFPDVKYARSIPLLKSEKVRSRSPDRALLLEYLIEIGCDPAAPDSYGFTPLHMACLYNSSIVSVLISRTIDVSTKSKFGWTPLHLAALGTNVDLAIMLIHAGAGLELTLKPVKETKPIKGFNHVEKAELFMGSLTPLGLAVAKANFVMVLHLLKSGVSPQMPDNSFRSGVLDIAARMAFITMLVLLSKQGVGFEKNQELPASNKSTENIVANPIRFEISTESYLLKSLRVDIDTLDGNQRTTLLRIVQDSSDGLDRTVTIQRLLDLGADPRVRYNDRRSVLHFSDTLSLDGIRALVKAGADLETKDRVGNTPLLHLVRQGRNIQKLQLLIELGANIYAKTYAGTSAWKLLSQRYKEGIAYRAISAISSDRSGLSDRIHKSETKKILNNAKKKKKPPLGWTG